MYIQEKTHSQGVSPPLKNQRISGEQSIRLVSDATHWEGGKLAGPRCHEPPWVTGPPSEPQSSEAPQHLSSGWSTPRARAGTYSLPAESFRFRKSINHSSLQERHTRDQDVQKCPNIPRGDSVALTRSWSVMVRKPPVKAALSWPWWRPHNSWGRWGGPGGAPHRPLPSWVWARLRRNNQNQVSSVYCFGFNLIRGQNQQP